MSSFHIINFGCRATQADGGEIEQELLSHSYEKKETIVDADVVILNTCTVTAAADRDARQTIRRVKRENPQAEIIVTGCYAQRAPEEIRQLPGVRLVIGNSHKSQLVKIVDERIVQKPLDSGAGVKPGAQSISGSLSCTAEIFVEPFLRAERKLFSSTAHFGATDRTRPSLKIQDGCDANCSFCIIPSVRGRSCSLAPDEVRRQVAVLVAAGFKEIVLSGIHLGSYGRDLSQPTTFFELLKDLESIEGLTRIRMSSIEPLEVRSQIVELVAESDKLAKHFHVPMQSGADRILHLMRRPYSSSQYASVVEMIRKKVDDAAIGADVITGFPGETDAEHRLTMEFIERSPLTYLHVFPFSPRSGTTAASLRGMVGSNVLKRRSAELRELGRQKKFKFQEKIVGKVLSVITLDHNHGDGTSAMSTNFLEVKIQGPALLPNQIFDVMIEGVMGGVLVGSVCSN